MVASRLARLEVPALGTVAFAAFLLALLGYGGYFAYYMLASFDVVNLHRDTFIDDAFYYFEIAKNLAAGKFSTFDGGITRTNGYHPVWLLLVTPFYWFLDLESALFGIKALEIILIAGGVCLMAWAMRLTQLPWILLFAVLPALYGQRGMIFGMEAAAGAFFLGATLLAAVLFVRDALRWRWLLAGVAFILPWVRLEYVAIALFVTAGLALLPGHGAALVPPRGHFSATRLRTAGLPFAAAVGGILAYFVYNGVVFGGIVPVSGAVKLALSAHWNATDGLDWGSATERFLETAGRAPLVVVELCGYLLVVWGVARSRGWNRDAVGLMAVLVTMLGLAVQDLAVKWQVAWFYAPRLEVYTYWYYVPGYLVAAVIVPVRLCLAIFLLRRFVPDRWTPWRRLATVVLCMAGLALTVDPNKLTEPFRFVEERRESLIFPVALFGKATAGFERMLPRDAILGSWDAGAIGYFASRPVVNLDGLVNSYDYQRLGADHVSLWLQGGGVPAYGVTHLVNGLADDVRRDFEYIGNADFYDGVAYRLKLWAYGDGRVRARSWRSMTSPSLGVDGRRTGYRMSRHGRAIEVFVPDCVPLGPAANVPEMLAFTWRDGASRQVRLWARPHRTQLGYCKRAFLLPHGAETAKRIFVDPTTVDRLVADVPPVLRSKTGVSVHVVQDRLLYVGEAGDDEQVGTNCLGDEQGRAGSYHYLHVHPSAPRDLPYDRLEFGFANYDQLLATMRRRSGGRCLAEFELPTMEIREIWTGEANAGDRTWQGRVDGLALRPAAVEGFLAAAVPILRTAAWVLYHNEVARKLLYVREKPAVGPEESRGCAAAPVWLHLYPQRVGDLPAWRQQHGFGDRGFDFREQGFVSGGRCFAAVPLPAYELSHLITGVPGGDEHTWHAG